MNVESRALALLVVFALGLCPLAPVVFAQEKTSELEDLKKQMLQMEEQFRQLQRQIEKLEKQAAPSEATGQPQAADPALQKKIQEVEAKASAALEASKKTFASQFNPAISLGIDTIGSYKSNAQRFNPGDGTGTRDAGKPTNNIRPDRKSTRLNSSHLVISYAVFCLKKKKHKCTR